MRNSEVHKTFFRLQKTLGPWEEKLEEYHDRYRTVYVRKNIGEKEVCFARDSDEMKEQDEFALESGYRLIIDSDGGELFIDEIGGEVVSN